MRLINKQLPKLTCFNGVMVDHNSRVQTQEKEFLKLLETKPFEHDTISITKYIEEVDPVLWKVISCH